MFDAPVFIDFEASSLSDDSWPIEVGMSWTDGKRVITHSSLIRPRHDWSSTEWDEGSAKIHNIPKRDLIAAPEADLVARWLEDLVDGRPLVSDALSFDERWLRLLVGPQDWCRVHSMDVALEWAFAQNGRINPGKLGLAYKVIRSQHTQHRAGPDAAGHAYAWRKVMKSKQKDGS